MSSSDEAAQEIYEYSRRGKVTEVEKLLDSIHPDTYVAYDGSTACLMACKNGHRTICELLVNNGADLSRRIDDGSSSLFLSACSGDSDLVRFVLNHRSGDINECNEDGFTPLDIAAHYNHIEIVELLRSHGGVSSGLLTPEVGEVNAGPGEKWGYGVFD